jgi:membrane protein implicated in regulation of membrane protease activity
MNKAFNNFIISCIASAGMGAAAFMLLGVAWLVEDGSTYILSIIGQALIFLTLALTVLTQWFYGRYLNSRAEQNKNPLIGQNLLTTAFYLDYAVLILTLAAGTLGIISIVMQLPGLLIGMAIPASQMLYVVWQDWIREQRSNSQIVMQG